jgi:hypothetical protein
MKILTYPAVDSPSKTAAMLLQIAKEAFTTPLALQQNSVPSRTGSSSEFKIDTI